MSNNLWKQSRFPVFMLSLAGAAILSSMVSANEIQVPFNLAASATSPAITLPGVNTPVSVTCANNQQGDRGVGQVTMQRGSLSQDLRWVGIDQASGAVSAAFNQPAGTHIIYCDAPHESPHLESGLISASFRPPVG